MFTLPFIAAVLAVTSLSWRMQVRPEYRTYHNARFDYSISYVTAVSAQRGTSVVRRLNFPRGQTSVEVQGTLRRGTSHDYLVRTRMGQGMAVRIISQGVIGFQIITPSGHYLSDVTVEWTGRLPQSGDYRINVLPDPTTNRAYRYTLEVVIE